MAKLKPGDLEKIAERMKKSMSLREGEARVKVIVHMGTCGIAAGSRTIVNAVTSCIDEANAHDVVVSTSACAGLCSREPMMTVQVTGQSPVKYVELTEEKAKKIFDDHVMKGEIVIDYALAMGSEQTL